MPQSLIDVPYRLDRIKALFIGSAKSGKSISAATFPKPMYVFDIDGRIKSLRNFFAPYPDNMEGITFDRFTNYDHFGTVFDRFENRCEYKTILIDSLTTLCAMIIRYSLKARGLSLIKPSDEYVAGTNKIADVPIPGFDEWNLEATVLREILYICSKKLECNVILTAHLYMTEEKEKDNQGKQITVPKYHLFTGGRKIAASIPAEFDEIYHFKGTDNKRSMYPHATDAVPFAGTTLGLPRQVDVQIDPKRKLSAGNGSLYHKIVENCKENGLIAKSA